MKRYILSCNGGLVDYREIKKGEWCLYSEVEAEFAKYEGETELRIDELKAEIARLGDENVRLKELLREIWDSTPDTYGEDDPMIEKHSRALNKIPKALAEKDKR